MTAGSGPFPKSTFCTLSSTPSPTTDSLISLSPQCRRLPCCVTSRFNAISSVIALSLVEGAFLAECDASTVDVLDKTECLDARTSCCHAGGSCRSWCDPPGVMANGVFTAVVKSLYEPRSVIGAFSSRDIRVGLEVLPGLLGPFWSLMVSTTMSTIYTGIR